VLELVVQICKAQVDKIVPPSLIAFGMPFVVVIVILPFNFRLKRSNDDSAR
jgi:hypothetical protein